MIDDKSEVSFVKEIRLMLFGMGDCQGPLLDTAKLLEEIIIKQVVSIINLSRNVASMRNSQVPAPEDVLFLMRKNTVGLKRLITYLAFKDERKLLNKTVGEAGDEDCPDEEGVVQLRRGTSTSWKTNRKMYCMEAVREFGIDESVLASVEDKLKQLRHNRADVTSLRISKQTYESYAGSRRASFGSASRFVNWLRIRGGVTNVELTSPMIEILQYVAKETLNQIIDMVFTLREQQQISQRVGQVGSIRPKEIQEVLRLCWSPQSFKLGILSKDLPVTSPVPPLPLQ